MPKEPMLLREASKNIAGQLPKGPVKKAVPWTVILQVLLTILGECSKKNTPEQLQAKAKKAFAGSGIFRRPILARIRKYVRAEESLRDEDIEIVADAIAREGAFATLPQMRAAVREANNP